MVRFVKGDNQRDTISLVTSCLFTLALCVYSAVHLNVPPKNEKRAKTAAREALWYMLALFIPELVVYFAWKQKLAVQQVCRAVNETVEKNARGGF